MKPLSTKDLVNKINLLRSRHVEWQYKKTTIWKEEEWLDAHQFNSEMLKLFESPQKVTVRHE